MKNAFFKYIFTLYNILSHKLFSIWVHRKSHDYFNAHMFLKYLVFDPICNTEIYFVIFENKYITHMFV